jgi:predicted GNAT family N-acyltransferase
MDVKKIKRFQGVEDALFSKCRDIRDIVFIVEQEVEEEEEFDEFEDSSYHFLLELNDEPVGTARWRRIGEKIKLERFAILKEHRNKGLGDLLVREVVKDVLANRKNKETIYLHAQLKAIPLYSRCGFEQVGDLFLECNIKHYKMIYSN